jgi:hypothetical protein
MLPGAGALRSLPRLDSAGCNVPAVDLPDISVNQKSHARARGVTHPGPLTIWPFDEILNPFLPQSPHIDDALDIIPLRLGHCKILIRVVGRRVRYVSFIFNHRANQ